MDGLKRGRVVYFRDSERDALVGHVAIVTHVANETTGRINCYLLPDGVYNVEPELKMDVLFSEEAQPGTWHWMFDGQQTRYQPDRVEVPKKRRAAKAKGE